MSTNSTFAPATWALSALIASACSVPYQPLGGDDATSTESGSESETGESGETGETGETGDGDCLETQDFTLDFTLDGLGPDDADIAWTCVAAVDAAGPTIIVTFTQCVDGEGMLQTDSPVLTLSGDWSEPPLDSDTPTTLRYIEQSNGQSADRWLALTTEGQFPLPLVAVDSSTLSPSGVEFDLGEVGLGLEPTDCPLFSHPGGCGSVTTLALVADYSGDLRTIQEGTAIPDLGAADGGDSVQFQVTVARARELAVNRCEDVPDRELVFGLVAYPNS